MNEYLGLLRERYQLQLSRNSPSAAALIKNGPCNGSLEINRFLKTQETPTTITAVQTLSNTISLNPTDIRSTFFRFSPSYLRPPPEQLTTKCTAEHIREFCGDLPHVPPDVGENLLAATSTTQVFNVLKDMKTGSAPGPDGLPIDFTRPMKTRNVIAEQLPRVEVEFLPLSRICELRAVSELTHKQAERCGRPCWAQSTCRVFPANVRDFGRETVSPRGE